MRALAFVPFVLLCAGALTLAEPVEARQTVELDPALRARLIAEHRMREAEWVRGARQGFPGDLWSQGDDLANAERRWVSMVADQHHLRVRDVLLALDQGLRETEREAPERGFVPPSMPRPFYD